MTPPPLALYIHTPWCVRKCPYCDFNSYPRPVVGALPFDRYVAALLEDLDTERGTPVFRERPLRSIFIGGGTPSLFPGPAIQTLLDGVRARLPLAADCEITLEANPGAVDAGQFAAYRAAGVNRLSLGIQSLAARQLRRLGRIHDPAQARAAVASARAAGFARLNLDLMFALPGQTLAEALRDLEALLALAPEHISWYELTLEPGTALAAAPPADRPDPDLAADMAQAGQECLARAGFRRYEISAYARRPGAVCRHNLNYWRFGDYLGIGAGAHGKLTAGAGRIWRTVRRADPWEWLRASPPDRIVSRESPDAATLAGEFALNALRLTDGFTRAEFSAATGLPWARIAPQVAAAIADGLLAETGAIVQPTPLGQRFLDDLTARFMAG